MKKRNFIIFAIVFTMMFSLTACKEDTKTTTKADQTIEETKEQETLEQETTISEEDTEQPTSSETTETEQQEMPSTETEQTDDLSLGVILNKAFEEEVKASPEISAEELANNLVSHEAVLFAGATVPVEPGMLTGFGEVEITGFEEGAMFAPTIGTIPFVGYIFTLEENADVDEFVKVLEENANPRWNICTEAEQTVVDAVDQTVFFLMCPQSLEN